MAEQILDLTLSDLRDLADDTARAAGRNGTPFGTYVFTADDPASELARHVERTVFLEAFGNTTELLAASYGPYEASTAFICVLDHRRALPAGGMRMILPGRLGSKTLDDLAVEWGQPIEDVWQRTGLVGSPEQVWDCATMSVGAGYRSGLISQAMLQAWVTSMRVCGARYVVTILDHVVLRHLQAMMRKPFAPFAGVNARSYLGSPSSLPCYADLLTWAERVEREAPQVLDVLYHGRGLEAAVSHPDWDAVPTLLPLQGVGVTLRP